MLYAYKTKNLKMSKVFVARIDRNIPSVRGTLIATKGKWRFEWKSPG
jgi:hypothetical protein